MHANKLYVIAVVSNPMRTESRPRLARAFAAHMVASGVNLILVEAALGQRSYELADLPAPVTHVPVRYSTIVWHKESLINIGLSRLPPAAEYVAWIDTDITFRTPTWAADTVHALQQFAVIQPWRHAYDLGPNGEHLDVNTSFASMYQRFEPVKLSKDRRSPIQIYRSYHSGYAFAARRETINAMGGLYDVAPLGSADHNMVFGMIGRIEETFPRDVSPQYTASMKAWQAKAAAAVRHRIGSLPGTIEHSWHGPKSKRGYTTRPAILRRHHFDPLTDLRYNLDRVIEITGDKPLMAREIEAYFLSRNEDANSL